METDTASSRSIELNVPGEEYFLTTFEEHDIEALQEVLSIYSVSDRLIKVPKPYVSTCIRSSRINPLNLFSQSSLRLW
jgi:hypothetical protein